jgi:hypothetical protein
MSTSSDAGDPDFAFGVQDGCDARSLVSWTGLSALRALADIAHAASAPTLSAVIAATADAVYENLMNPGS